VTGRADYTGRAHTRSSSSPEAAAAGFPHFPRWWCRAWSEASPHLGDRLHDAGQYPVPGRTSERNRLIAGHEIGHAFLARALGSTVHSCSIIPGDGFEGRVIRSGKSQLDFTEYPRAGTEEVLDGCERLERLAPEVGSGRVGTAKCIFAELAASPIN